MMRKFFETISAMLDLRTTEIRTGISLIQAVEADSRRVELLAVTGSQDAANECISMAVELTKNAVTPDEVEPMIRIYHKARMFGIDADDLFEMVRDKVRREGGVV